MSNSKLSSLIQLGHVCDRRCRTRNCLPSFNWDMTCDRRCRTRICLLSFICDMTWDRRCRTRNCLLSFICDMTWTGGIELETVYFHATGTWLVTNLCRTRNCLLSFNWDMTCDRRWRTRNCLGRMQFYLFQLEHAFQRDIVYIFVWDRRIDVKWVNYKFGENFSFS